MVRSMITISWAYDPNPATQGIRILVDRLWPRGLSKETLNVERWMREIAPSNELRKWYSHVPERWDEFKRRYFSELEINPLTEDLIQLCRKKDVVFIFSSRERIRNNAAALMDYVVKHL